MKLGPLLDEFARYALESYSANIRLSIEEMRDFLENFFTRRTFFINDLIYYGATSKDPDGEQRFSFAEEEFTTKDYIEAILPELITLYTNAYGAPDDQPFVKDWSPKPFKANTATEVQQAAIMKKSILNYNQQTLPFRLSKTMHHPLATISFSSSQGKIYREGKKGEVTITSPEEIELFLDSKTFHSLDGGKHEGLRDLWFQVLNEDASNPKFGWIDIDNPAKLPEEDLKAVVKDISKQLEKAERKHIIMFSGRGYHVWFAPRTGERFNYATDVKNIAESYGAKAGAWVGASTTYQKQAIAKQMIYIDTSVYSKNRAIPFFFGMHYKLQNLEDSTGLVRIPLKRSELSSFNPLVDAHPETVLERFTELKARVDMFCQQVGLGEGFPYADAGYPCYRTARGNNDQDHELVKALQTWKKPKMTEISKRTIGEELLQADEIVLTPKLDGWLGVMSFNTMGKFVVNGTKLDTLQQYEGMTDSIQSEKQRTVMSTKGGLFAWDNYLTHAFEAACRSIGVTEAIVTGEIVTYNDLGQVAGRESVTSILNRQVEDSEEDGVAFHDKLTFRRLKFVIHDVLSFDGSEVSRDLPITQRLALMSEVKNDRISVIPHQVITEDATTNFEAFWKKYKEEANNEGVVAYTHDRRYKVKSKYTLDAAIIGIDMSTKTWLDQKDMLSTVIVAVTKQTSKGPTFVAFQRVGNFRMSDEERRVLFYEVLGEQTGEWDRYGFTNALPYEIEYTPDILFVDPKVVVEIEYESLGNKTRPAYAFHHQQTRTKGSLDSATMERGYRFVPIAGRAGALASRRLMGPPVIIRTRPDKSTANPRDISHEQADGAGGLQISKKPEAISSEELENPAPFKVTHVRTNPLYGYARGPRYIAGGGISSPSGTEYPAGHMSFGGKDDGDVKRTLEQEFTGLGNQGKGEWKPNYKPIWDQARQHPQTGVAYYPEMTGLSQGSSDAIYDERGPNIPGSRAGIIEQQSAQFSLKKLLTEEYHNDADQNAEDGDQFGRALRKELKHAPGTTDSQYMLATLVGKEIDEEDKQKLIKQKMRAKNFGINKAFSGFDRDIRNNPASTNSVWNQRADAYRVAHQHWDKTPSPKPEWLTIALKTYEAWEIPLLEKGRQFMDAEDNFLYTASEEAIIHGRFPGNEAEGQHIFAAIEIEAGEDDEFGREDTDSP